MTIDKIRQQVKEWKDAREKATQLTGFEEQSGMRSCDPESDPIYFLIGPPSDTCESDSKFITLAANEWDRIMENYLAMAEALEFYGSCAIKVWEPPCNNLGERARQTLEKVAGEL